MQNISLEKQRKDIKIYKPNYFLLHTFIWFCVCVYTRVCVYSIWICNTIWVICTLQHVHMYGVFPFNFIAWGGCVCVCVNWYLCEYKVYICIHFFVWVSVQIKLWRVNLILACAQERKNWQKKWTNIAQIYQMLA